MLPLSPITLPLLCTQFIPHLPLLHNCTLLGVTKALRNMNKRLNLPQLQKIMMQFERESEIMDLKEETISDTIDDVIGEEDEDEVGLVITPVHTQHYMHTHITCTQEHNTHTLHTKYSGTPLNGHP